MRQIYTKLVKLIRILVVSRYRRALKHGVAAGVEHSALVKSLNIGALIDIGANKGQFSLLFTELFPGAKITAFEPLEGPYNTFSTVFKDDLNVVIHNVAIGKDDSLQAMHVSQKMDSSSLLEISDLQVATFPGTGEKGQQNVTVKPITEYISADTISPDTFVKIDVQGYELIVLESMEPILPKIKWVYVEVSFVELYKNQPLANDVIAFLISRGYTLASIGNPTNSAEGSTIQTDLLFVNSASREQQDTSLVVNNSKKTPSANTDENINRVPAETAE